MIQLQCSIQEKRGYKRILFLQWYHLAKNLVDMTGENAYTRVLTTYDSRGEELWMFRIESVKTYSMQNLLCVTTWFISTIYMRYGVRISQTSMSFLSNEIYLVVKLYCCIQRIVAMYNNHMQKRWLCLRVLHFQVGKIKHRKIVIQAYTKE